ncbi:MAG: hypothetical protein QXO75_12185 [Nitrososphaerota archaeon]
MFLVQRPISIGATQDAYDTLQAVFEGSDFSAQEAIAALMESLGMTQSQASATLSRLYTEGSITE